MEVRDPPRDADVADADLGLDSAGSMNDAYEPLGPGRPVDDRARSFGRRGPGLPFPEQALGNARDIESGQLAGDDQRHPRGVEATRMCGPQRVTVEGLDRFLAASGGSVVRRVG